MMFQTDRCLRCVNAEIAQHPTEFHLTNLCPHQPEIIWELTEVKLNQHTTVTRNTSHCPSFYSIDAQAKGVCLECGEKRVCRFNPVLCKVVWAKLGWEGGELDG